MKYNWDLKELIKRKNELEKLARKNKNNIKILTDLDMYNYLLEVYISSKLNSNNIYIVDDEEIYDNTNFNKIPKDIKDDILLADKHLKKYKESLNEIKLNSINMTNDDIFYIVRTIFYEIPDKKIKERFDKFTTNNLIHITYNKFNYDEFSGITLNDIEKQIPYSFIYRNNNILDIVTLTHEISHMIFRYKEKENFKNSNKYYYAETEGYLFDIICYDKLIELGFCEDEINTLIRRKLNVNKFYSKEFINDIKINKGYSLEEAKDNAKEIISYLSSLDLYELFKKDKEKCMYNLENLISCNDESINKNLENCGVTFNQDNCKNLRKTIKKVKFKN